MVILLYNNFEHTQEFQHRNNTSEILLQTKLTVNVTNLIGHFILIMQQLLTFQSTK